MSVAVDNDTDGLQAHRNRHQLSLPEPHTGPGVVMRQDSFADFGTI